MLLPLATNAPVLEQIREASPSLLAWATKAKMFEERCDVLSMNFGSTRYILSWLTCTYDLLNRYPSEVLKFRMAPDRIKALQCVRVFTVLVFPHVVGNRVSFLLLCRRIVLKIHLLLVLFFPRWHNKHVRETHLFMTCASGDVNSESNNDMNHFQVAIYTYSQSSRRTRICMWK